ncbi:MAG: beta strand repeat-containing protein, partial [Terriglobia bacterium]
MKDWINTSKRKAARSAVLVLFLSLAAVTLLASGPENQKVPPAAKGQKYKIASGADQILSSIYDPATRTIRVSGAGSGGGTVTNVGLSMPGTFSVTGGPITSSGTLSVNWAQPVSIANGGTGQTSTSSAFNALAPSTAAGGLIYGTGLNTYGNLSIGSSGQCLGSNGATLVWTACGSGSVLTLAGDLSGTFASQTVTGLQGHSVSASAPAGGQVLEWSSSANAWTPAALPAFGTVSSVGLTMPSIFNLTGSPITNSGALTVTLAAQASNTVLAGPAVGAAGTPAFRTLTGPDIPAINLGSSGNGGITGTLGVANGGTGLVSAGSNGQCLASNGTSLVWNNCGTGSVTSVGLTLPSGFGASGSPVTTSGTLGISMPAGWGTGSLIVGNGANSVAALPLGFSGQCLTSNGTTVAWGSCGTIGISTTFQVNGANAGSQTPINFQSGGYIVVTNPSAGNIQFNFSGPLTVANGGTGLTAPGASGQCLGSNGAAMIWQSCGASGPLLETNGVNDIGQSSLNLVNGSNITFSNTSGGTVTASVSGTLSPSALPAINLATTGGGGVTGTLATANGGTGLNSLGSAGQCLTSTGVTALWGACGGGALPSGWTQNGTTGAVVAQPLSTKDAVPLTVASALSSAGTADIFDVCQTNPCTTANKFFGVTWNGNLNFQASNLQLSTTGPAPYLYLDGINGNPGQPYLKLATAALNVPACPVSAVATGGTLAAATYYFKCTWVNTAGETTGSAEASVTTTGSTSTITMTAPGIQYSAYGYQVYESLATGTEELMVPTSSNCTLSAQTFGGHAVCDE